MRPRHRRKFPGGSCFLRNIVGLPLYETMTLLGGEGFPIHFGWLNAV